MLQFRGIIFILKTISSPKMRYAKDISLTNLYKK